MLLVVTLRRYSAIAIARTSTHSYVDIQYGLFCAIGAIASRNGYFLVGISIARVIESSQTKKSSRETNGQKISRACRTPSISMRFGNQTY